MTRKRIAPVLTIAALLIAAWSLQAFANMQPMPGPMGPPMQMPMKVGPKKCSAPPPACMPQGCGPVGYQAPGCAPMPCPPQGCAPAPCPPQACAPAPCPPQACPPPMCPPPGCPPPMCGPGFGGGGMLDSPRDCLGAILGIIGTPFRLLDNILCAQKKPCPVKCCPPPPCFPMACAPPAKVSKRSAARASMPNSPGFMR